MLLHPDGAKVRVIHAAPPVGPVDVAVQNGATLIRGLAFTKGSRYLDVAPATYTVFAVGGVEGKPVELVPVLDARGVEGGVG